MNYATPRMRTSALKLSKYDKCDRGPDTCSFLSVLSAREQGSLDLSTQVRMDER